MLTLKTYKRLSRTRRRAVRKALRAPKSLSDPFEIRAALEWGRNDLNQHLWAIGFFILLFVGIVVATNGRDALYVFLLLAAFVTDDYVHLRSQLREFKQLCTISVVSSPDDSSSFGG